MPVPRTPLQVLVYPCAVGWCAHGYNNPSDCFVGKTQEQALQEVLGYFGEVEAEVLAPRISEIDGSWVDDQLVGIFRLDGTWL